MAGKVCGVRLSEDEQAKLASRYGSVSAGIRAGVILAMADPPAEEAPAPAPAPARPEGKSAAPPARQARPPDPPDRAESPAVTAARQHLADTALASRPRHGRLCQRCRRMGRPSCDRCRVLGSL